MLTKVGETVLPAIESHGPIEAWIIDDTGFPKQGKHSVGVARQYCGHLGKQDNCQVALSLSLANHHASLPVAWRLYLPKEWASDEERRRKVGVPEEIEFRTKPQIALEQIEAACEAGLPRGVVLMDAGYGCDTQLLAGVSALALTDVAGILPNTTVWTSDTEPPPPKKWSGRGRRPKRLRRDDGHKPISVEELALGLPRRAWRKIMWREGGCERLSSRFARVRVSCRASRLHSHRASAGRVAVGRVARRRGETHQILVLDASEDHCLPQIGGHHQAALAYRARLSGTEARGRARSLRRPRLARLPPSRHAVYRGLRIRGLREGDDSPLRTSFHCAVRRTCRSPR